METTGQTERLTGNNLCHSGSLTMFIEEKTSGKNYAGRKRIENIGCDGMLKRRH